MLAAFSLLPSLTLSGAPSQHGSLSRAGSSFKILRRKSRCSRSEPEDRSRHHVRAAGAERRGQDLDDPHDDRDHHAGLGQGFALRQAFRQWRAEARRLPAGRARALQEDEGDRPAGVSGRAARSGVAGSEAAREAVVREAADHRLDRQEDRGAVEGHAAEDPVHLHAAARPGADHHGRAVLAGSIR